MFYTITLNINVSGNSMVNGSLNAMSSGVRGAGVTSKKFERGGD